MANTHETIKDIRKDAEAKFRELVEAYMQRRSAFQTTVGAMQAFNNVFDRLEAAHKREVSETVTGSNQLRRALELAMLYFSLSPEDGFRSYVKNGKIEMLHARNVLNAISSALAATSIQNTQE